MVVVWCGEDNEAVRSISEKEAGVNGRVGEPPQVPAAVAEEALIVSLVLVVDRGRQLKNEGDDDDKRTTVDDSLGSAGRP